MTARIVTLRKQEYKEAIYCMKVIFFCLVCFLLLSYCNGQKVEFGNNYEVTFVKESNYFSAPQQVNKTSYYCTFRGQWTRERHPVEYPATTAARWSSPVVFSHSVYYEPWQAGKQLTYGMERMSETGFSDLLVNELSNVGEHFLDISQEDSAGYYVYNEEGDLNPVDFVHLPPIEVSYQYPYLTSVAGMHPSPDWFTGLYNFYVADEYQRTYFDRFAIATFPFDGGTDGGDSYTSVDEELNPPETCTRITVENAPGNGIYVSPDGSTVLPVAEWDCELVLGDAIRERPQCDYLKYPNCHLEKCIQNQTAHGCMECDPNLPSCEPPPPPPAPTTANTRHQFFRLLNRNLQVQRNVLQVLEPQLIHQHQERDGVRK